MDNVLWCGLSVRVLVYRVYTANKRVTSSFYNRQRRRSGKMYLDAPFLQEALPQSCAAVRTTSELYTRRTANSDFHPKNGSMHCSQDFIVQTLELSQ
jgi:hypothetical protein